MIPSSVPKVKMVEVANPELREFVVDGRHGSWE